MTPNDYTLPTQPGFYSRPSIYPDMAWMLDRRGDWCLVTMSGRAGSIRTRKRVKP